MEPMFKFHFIDKSHISNKQTARDKTIIQYYCDHKQIDELLKRLDEMYPQILLGTIYRVLGRKNWQKHFCHQKTSM